MSSRCPNSGWAKVCRWLLRRLVRSGKKRSNEDGAEVPFRSSETEPTDGAAAFFAHSRQDLASDEFRFLQLHEKSEAGFDRIMVG